MNYESRITNKAIAAFLFLMVVSGVFGLADSASSEEVCPGVPPGDPKCYYVLDNPLYEVNTIPGLICKVLSFLSSKVMPPVAVFMALYASFLLLISVGNPGKVTAARNVLLYTVVGAGIILLSVPLIALVLSIIGAGAIVSCDQQAATTTFMDTVIKLINWFSWFIGIWSVAVGL